MATLLGVGQQEAVRLGFWAERMAIIQLGQQRLQRTGVEARDRTFRAIEVAGRPGVAFGYLAETPIAPA